MYLVFGSCKDITLGPTALLALMTYEQIQGRNFDYAILLCFLTGVVQFAMGILHLGLFICLDIFNCIGIWAYYGSFNFRKKKLHLLKKYII